MRLERHFNRATEKLVNDYAYRLWAPTFDAPSWNIKEAADWGHCWKAPATEEP